MGVSGADNGGDREVEGRIWSPFRNKLVVGVLCGGMDKIFITLA